MSFSENSSKITFEVFTDGGCLGNPGFGGWAYHINVVHGTFSGDGPLEGYGAVGVTTNNQMELTADIKALEYFNTESYITIYTDSKYLKNGIEIWIKNWINNKWKTSSKTNVKNKDLWTRLNQLINKHSVKWEWVKGHDGNVYNDKADELAQKYIKKIK